MRVATAKSSNLYPEFFHTGWPKEGNYSAPAFFNGYVYFAAVNDALKAFQLTKRTSVQRTDLAIRGDLPESWRFVCSLG